MEREKMRRKWGYWGEMRRNRGKEYSKSAGTSKAGNMELGIWKQEQRNGIWNTVRELDKRNGYGNGESENGVWNREIGDTGAVDIG